MRASVTAKKFRSNASFYPTCTAWKPCDVLVEKGLVAREEALKRMGKVVLK